MEAVVRWWARTSSPGGSNSRGRRQREPLVVGRRHHAPARLTPVFLLSQGCRHREILSWDEPDGRLLFQARPTWSKGTFLLPLKKTTKPKQKAYDVELCQAWVGERVFAFLFRLYINDALLCCLCCPRGLLREPRCCSTPMSSFNFYDSAISEDTPLNPIVPSLPNFLWLQLCYWSPKTWKWSSTVAFRISNKCVSKGQGWNFPGFLFFFFSEIDDRRRWQLSPAKEDFQWLDLRNGLPNWRIWKDVFCFLAGLYCLWKTRPHN